MSGQAWIDWQAYGGLYTLRFRIMRLVLDELFIEVSCFS